MRSFLPKRDSKKNRLPSSTAAGIFSNAFDASRGGAGNWLNRIEASKAISLLLQATSEGVAFDDAAVRSIAKTSDRKAELRRVRALHPTRDRIEPAIIDQPPPGGTATM